jgi:hypothetical protein
MHALLTHDENSLSRIEDPNTEAYRCNPEPGRGLGAGTGCVHIENRILPGCRAGKNAANRPPGAVAGLFVPKSAVRYYVMITKTKVALLGGIVLCSLAAFRPKATAQSPGPVYTSDAQLKFPERYREWIYLTSGFDMSYNPSLQTAGHHMFDNVFVNPEAYKAFLETGKWPDKTTLVLEARRAQGKGSINEAGNYQDSDVMGLEVHVKDETRFPGKWAFFTFNGGKTGKMVTLSEDCYSCHSEHAAVDTTFVQFYPTLLPIAKTKGTLAASYQKESGKPTPK